MQPRADDRINPIPTMSNDLWLYLTLRTLIKRAVTIAAVEAAVII